MGWKDEEALECNATTYHGPSALQYMLQQYPVPKPQLSSGVVYFAVHIFLPACRTPGTSDFFLLSVVCGAGRSRLYYALGNEGRDLFKLMSRGRVQ